MMQNKQTKKQNKQPKKIKAKFFRLSLDLVTCDVDRDSVDPAKQDGVVYRIPCECCQVYIGETGRSMQDRIKEHDRDIRFARTETSAVSEHAHNTGHKPLWNEVKFIDRDPHYYTRRVKEAIHIRLHPDNINRHSGIEIPEAWMPTIKKHNNRRACDSGPPREQITE